MSDRFHPISMEQLTDWVFTELERKGSLFNVPRPAFFVPRPDHRFRLSQYGVELETPFGVAAGPHTQMAQNIVTAWLVGARLMVFGGYQVFGGQMRIDLRLVEVESGKVLKAVHKIATSGELSAWMDAAGNAGGEL